MHRLVWEGKAQVGRTLGREAVLEVAMFRPRNFPTQTRRKKRPNVQNLNICSGKDLGWEI